MGPPKKLENSATLQQITSDGHECVGTGVGGRGLGGVGGIGVGGGVGGLKHSCLHLDEVLYSPFDPGTTSATQV